MRPFLKWAGGKYLVLKHIKAMLPPGKRLIEPFIGAGSVFLNTEYEDHLLADNNPDLINTYNYLQSEHTKFIKYCQKFFQEKYNTKEVYYEFREEFNTTKNMRRKAALFLYLNRHAYNGLCRYNSSGGFNAPYGYYKKPYIPEENIARFATKLQDASLAHADFETTMQAAKPGDVFYCDPPYVPLSDTAYFTSYSRENFTFADQQRLANICNDLAAQGVSVLISNHDMPETRKLYKNAINVDSFSVMRNISCKATNRKPARELLALFADPAAAHL